MSESPSDPFSNERLVRGFVGWLRRSRLIFYAGVGVAIVVTLSVGGALIATYHHHMESSKFSGVHTGMSKQDVRSIMGAPDDTSTADGGAQASELTFLLDASGYQVNVGSDPRSCWWYGGSNDRPSGRLVCFNQNGNVIEKWSKPQPTSG